MSRPEFTAEELNRLGALSRKPGEQGVYYTKAKSFVLDTLDTLEVNLTEKQINWLWGIKVELGDD